MVVGQAALDQDGVDDRQRGRGKSGSRDQRRLARPVEQEVGDERGDHERAEKRRDSDSDRGPSTVSHVARIDLHACEEGEHDGCELGDEIKPSLTGQVKDVADDHPKRKLDQGNGDTQLHRDHRCDQHDHRENGCELYRAHTDLLLRVCGTFGRGHQPPEGRLGASLIARCLDYTGRLGSTLDRKGGHSPPPPQVSSPGGGSRREKTPRKIRNRRGGGHPGAGARPPFWRRFTGLMATAQKPGWALVALDCAVDTTTPAGQAMANVLATFAQFQRRLISQRTQEALAVKRAQGVRVGRPARPCRRRWSNASGGSVPRARVSPRSLTGSTLIACRPRKVGASGIRRRSATWRHAAPFRPEHRLPESDARALEPYDHTRDLRARVRGDGARRADGAADGGGVRGGAAVSRGCAACIAQAADGLVSGGVSAAEAVEASSRRRSGPGVRGIYLSVLSQVDAARPRLYAAKLQDHEAA